jgi:hypothetical protein
MKDMKIMKWKPTERRSGHSPVGGRPVERARKAAREKSLSRPYLHLLHALLGEISGLGSGESAIVAQPPSTNSDHPCLEGTTVELLNEYGPGGRIAMLPQALHTIPSSK